MWVNLDGGDLPSTVVVELAGAWASSSCWEDTAGGAGVVVVVVVDELSVCCVVVVVVGCGVVDGAGGCPDWDGDGAAFAGGAGLIELGAPWVVDGTDTVVASGWVEAWYFI